MSDGAATARAKTGRSAAAIALRLAVLAFAVLTGTIAVLAGTAAARADLLDDIRARGVVRIGVKGDYEPFGYRDASGALVGFDVDVGRRLAEAVGATPEFRAVTSADRLQRLASGDIDIVVATLGDTAERRRLVTMIEPGYYGGGATVMVRPDSGILGWGDLRGHTLCALQGALWNRPFAQRFLVDVRSYQNLRDVKLALGEGQCAGWLYDEAALAHEAASGDWPGYRVLAPPQMVLPWAVAIAQSEGGGRLDRLLGDTVAEMHRSGWLRALEARWKLPSSAFNQQQEALWASLDGTAQPLCRRQDDGRWPLACREIALVTSEEADGVVGMWLSLRDMTGIDLSIFYDGFDRRQFLIGLGVTAALALASAIGCIVFGIVVGWLVHRRIPVLRPLLVGAVSVLRMTPPLLQLYLVFFGFGSIVAGWGFTFNGFAVAVVVLSAYAGAANAVAFAEGADVTARGGRPLAFTPGDIGRVVRLAYPSLMGSAVNIVKATGMASMIAVPELVHASTAIIAENGNAATMMNVLLACYVVLIFLVVRAFAVVRRRIIAP